MDDETEYNFVLQNPGNKELDRSMKHMRRDSTISTLVTARRSMLIAGIAVCLQTAMLTCGPSTSALADHVEALTDEEMALIRTAEARRIESIESVYGAVVAVYGKDRQGGGSAVVYDQCGLALTNHHVVAGAGKEGWGGLADGKKYPWKLIGTDPCGDVAIIQLAGKNAFPAAPLGDSDTVRVGDWAMAMGNPFLLAEDQRPTATLGVVSGVRRYQPGSGLNMLVYGNCIQVDSSINPGNSGGPLFNIRGEIIGINGRGSFKERGRVNVGLGYAISSNQIKNFLPDLLATKIAQHGTLDAVFDDRDGKVVCQTLNLDSPVAAAGLKLGDQLIEFEGVSIQSANQFTNLISTLPADWPAHLVYQRDSLRQSIWVRLYALPYQTEAPQPAQSPPDEQKEADDEKEEESGEESDEPNDSKKKKKIQRKGRPQREQPRSQVPIVNPGTISNEKLNQENCRRLIARWKDDVGFGRITGDVNALRVLDEMRRGNVTVGRQEIVIATDGRFRVDVSDGPLTQTLGFDGKRYWSRVANDPPSLLAASKARLNPYIAQVATLATLFCDEPLAEFGKVLIDGSDKSQRQPAYRIKAIDSEGDWFYVWLSVLDEMGQLSVRLLKSSPNINGNGPSGAVTYLDWRQFEKVRLPYRRDFVDGLAEEVQLSFVTTNCQLLHKVSDEEFQITEHAIENQ